MSGEELADLRQRRERRREEAEGQVRVDRVEVEARVDEPAGEDRLQLRGEDDEVVD